QEDVRVVAALGFHIAGEDHDLAEPEVIEAARIVHRIIRNSHRENLGLSQRRIAWKLEHHFKLTLRFTLLIDLYGASGGCIEEWNGREFIGLQQRYLLGTQRRCPLSLDLLDLRVTVEDIDIHRQRLGYALQRRRPWCDQPVLDARQVRLFSTSQQRELRLPHAFFFAHEVD